jgi:hypothetical protein
MRKTAGKSARFFEEILGVNKSIVRILIARRTRPVSNFILSSGKSGRENPEKAGQIFPKIFVSSKNKLRFESAPTRKLYDRETSL